MYIFERYVEYVDLDGISHYAYRYLDKDNLNCHKGFITLSEWGPPGCCWMVSTGMIGHGFVGYYKNLQYAKKVVKKIIRKENEEYEERLKLLMENLENNTHSVLLKG